MKTKALPSPPPAAEPRVLRGRASRRRRRAERRYAGPGGMRRLRRPAPHAAAAPALARPAIPGYRRGAALPGRAVLSLRPPPPPLLAAAGPRPRSAGDGKASPRPPAAPLRPAALPSTSLRLPSPGTAAGGGEPGTSASAAAAPGASLLPHTPPPPPPFPAGRPGLPARRSSSIAAASCAASRDSSAIGAAAPGCPQRPPEPSALSRDPAERRVMGGRAAAVAGAAPAPLARRSGAARGRRAPLRRRRGAQRRAGCMAPVPGPGAACEQRERQRAWLAAAASPARGAPDAARAFLALPLRNFPASRGTRGERSPPGGAGEGHLLPPTRRRPALSPDPLRRGRGGGGLALLRGQTR